MVVRGTLGSHYGLENHGIVDPGDVFWNLPTARLYEEAVRRREGIIAHMGPLVVRTGQHTGRSANDKFTVREPSTQDEIWWGNVNKPITSKAFDDLHRRVSAYLRGKDMYVQDAWAGADPDYRIGVRVITEYAWHGLFARNMFLNPYQILCKPDAEALDAFIPDYTVIDVPNVNSDPSEHGTNSEVFVVLNLAKKLVLIGGTNYGGEIKKSIFTILNYLLPKKNVLSMHCSANQGKDGDVALYFGLSGTGKTTLSSSPDRYLIGDDEHGWSENGVFNFEGGCYAKVICLSPEKEPEIYSTTRRFGTILENVMVDAQTRRVDLDDNTLTQNTRASYPITHLDNIVPEYRGGHPRNIFFLTADAFGVMPPISKLTTAQAMYHFLSGYTAKVAGTEKGLGSEPQATFSACFGAPFLPLHPLVYAKLLADKMEKHNTNVWLINTGWTAGPYGTGHRMDLPYTRATIRAALNGELEEVEYIREPAFGLYIPQHVPNVPDDVLIPRQTWTDPAAYDRKARELGQKFRDNFRQYEDEATQEMKAAGPNVG